MINKILIIISSYEMQASHFYFEKKLAIYKFGLV